MIDDFYQAALSALQHHLDEAEASYSLDEGEVLFAGHRLGLAIAFEGFVRQGAHTLAELDIRIHVDGDSGDKFRVGTLGIGQDNASAMHDAISQWHLLAAAPLLAALGAPVETRRAAGKTPRFGAWDLFAGRIGLRGNVPPELRAGGAFYLGLLECLREVVTPWESPGRFALRSIYVMATRDAGACEIQAAIDGLVDEKLIAALAELGWPASGEAYLYKQLFVLRHPDAP